jgi:chaperonin GroES
MKLKPCHDNIFVEKDKPEEKKTPGGIVVPTKAQDKPDTATVLAVGPGRETADGKVMKPGVHVGDKIVIGKYAGTEVQWEDESRTIVAWSDVLGIVEDDSKEG